MAISILRFVFIAILAIIGTSLSWLGAELAWLGGSLYYLAAGGACLLSAWLIFRKDWRGVWLYAIFLLATLAWALWEAGLDGWALAPRLVLPTALGLWMLSTPFRRGMGTLAPLRGSRALWSGLALAAVFAIAFTLWTDRIAGGHEFAARAGPTDAAQGEWRHYGNDQGGSRFSPLAQITPLNVGGLERIWTYRTGPSPGGAPASFQVNPLMLAGRVHICTGWNDIIALDAETGRQVWRRGLRADGADVINRSCRGLAHYKVPNLEGACAFRIYSATIDARLVALDARTGQICRDFGRNGEVDLTEGMGPVEKGYYYATSPPAVIRGKLVIGGWVTDGQKLGEPSGVIRSYDATTGAFAWAFDSGRPDFHGMPDSGESFTQGTPNSWAPMSSDEELGLVYVPTGNATPDFVGMHRTANDERYSSSVIALDAETGAVRWSFQTVHHDLWDYDTASQPSLVDLPGGVPALIQATKRGEIFVLDRRTGKPIFPVVERPAPQGAVPGDRMAPTQPFSPKLPTFGGPPPSEKTMWGLTPIDQAICRIRFRQARFDGSMTPVGIDRPTITWPGSLGGIDWGGVAIDKQRLMMIVNNNQVANYNRLLPRAAADRMGIVPMAPGGKPTTWGAAAQAGTPYAVLTQPFLSPLAVPCQQPPYGRISAVDLRSGKLLWSERFGTSRDSGPFLLRTFLPIPMGVPNLGGAVATAGGVTFVGATQEHMFRAYDTRTGKELWKAALPAGGQSTPAVYWSSKSGREFVVIAAGGHAAMLSGSADQLIAYALPKGKLR